MFKNNFWIAISFLTLFCSPSSFALNWHHSPTLKASSGAIINVDYQVQNMGNTTYATPLWINVYVPAYQCNPQTTVSAVIVDTQTWYGEGIEHNVTTAQEGATLYYTNNCKFTVGLPENVAVNEGEDGYGYSTTHTISLIINGQSQINPVNGQNTFDLPLDSQD
jgi:hypothetical protein